MADTETDAGGVRFGTPQGRWLLLATILGSGLAGIDATVVNVALPAIGESFDASFATLQWTVSAYALTLAAFILVGGVLGDRLGRRRVFVIGVVWFALASLACGLAPSAGVLIAARALQGVGAALLTPGSLAMLQASFAPEDRARAIGAWSGLGGVATAIGPFLGGWLVDFASWHWVFLINVPIAALVVWIAVKHVPESRDETAAPGLDVAGATLGVIALAGVSYALISSGEQGWSTWVLVSAAVGVLAGVAFWWVERTSDHPMLPLSVFSSRQFSAVNAMTLTVYAGLGVVMLLLVVQLQVVSGFGAIAAGVSLLPATVLMLLLSGRSGDLASRIGPRLQLTVGPVLVAAGMALMVRIGPDASYVVDVLVPVAVMGLGLSAMVAPLTATALASVDSGHSGLASGVNNAVARTGGLLAVAAIPAVAGLSGQVESDPAAFDAGFDRAVLIAAGLVLAGGLLGWLTIRNDVLADESPGERPDDASPEQLRHCGVAAPPLASTTQQFEERDCGWS